MVVCRNWSSGYCRFGDNCRFEHPIRGAPQTTQNGNRFGSNQNNAPLRNNNYSNQNGSPTLPYGLDKAAILTDLTTEAPQWILSAYGPGRFAPIQLFGGAREQSFEEMRLLHYIAMAAGNSQQAAQEAEMLFQTAQQQMQAAASNVDEAIKFITSGENEHPNRLDIVNQTPQPSGAPNPFARTASPLPPGPAANPFGAPSQSMAPAGAFGQPSGLGVRQTPFGAPSQIGGSSSFGQPSALGGGAFGQPSTLGNSTPFGQSSGVQNASPFGQPSILGQSTNPFGSPSNTPPAAPFSAFSNTPAPFQQSQAPSAFGNTIQSVQPTPFGQPSAFAAQSTQSSSPFNNIAPQPFRAPSPAPKNPFGGPSQASVPTNAFGTGSSMRTTNPFGQVSTTSSAPMPFGSQPASISPMPNSFRQTQQASPAPFGNSQVNAPAAPSVFGQPIQQAAPAPFGNPQANAPAVASPFGQPRQQVTTGASSSFGSARNPPQRTGNNFAIVPSSRDLDAPTADVSTYCTKDHSGRLTSFKNQRVVYQEDKPGFKRPDGKWQKIMFPLGAPAPNRDTALWPENYSGNDALKAEYQYSAQHGVFRDGKMPLVPPLQQWCSFDF